MNVARRIDDHWARIVAQLRHQAETGTIAAIITSIAEETPMSEQPAQPESPLAMAKRALEQIDEDAVTTVRYIKAHPDLAAAFDDLGAIALVVAQGAGIPVGWMPDALGGLRVLRNAFAPKSAAA